MLCQADCTCARQYTKPLLLGRPRREQEMFTPIAKETCSVTAESSWWKPEMGVGSHCMVWPAWFGLQALFATCALGHVMRQISRRGLISSHVKNLKTWTADAACRRRFAHKPYQGKMSREAINPFIKDVTGVEVLYSGRFQVQPSQQPLGLLNVLSMPLTISKPKFNYFETRLGPERLPILPQSPLHN